MSQLKLLQIFAGGQPDANISFILWCSTSPVRLLTAKSQPHDVFHVSVLCKKLDEPGQS